VTDPTASPTTEIHGHRGARGHRPENTLPSFAHALELGVDALELDVGLSADGAVVLNHDQTISAVNCRDTGPLTPGDPMFPYTGRAVRELTLAQLKTLDAGVREPAEPFAETLVPMPGTPPATLTEVCELLESYAAGDVRLCVELKTDPSWPDAEVAGLVEAVVATLDRHGLSPRSRLLGFDWRVLSAAIRVAPAITRVALVEPESLEPDAGRLDGRRLADFGADPAEALAAAAASAGADILSPKHVLLDGELLRSAHAHGLPVTVWTVNEPAEMRRFVDLGVDAIVTDYPDRLRGVLAGCGRALPTAYAAPLVTASGYAEIPDRAADTTPR
jgi:glycerophosphoryl diester phosphodiesterase